MTQPGLHESFARDETIALPSERKFGVTMAVIFLLLAAFVVYKAGYFNHSSMALAGIGAIFLALATLAPAALRAPNRWWMKLGLLLHRFVNPVIMLLLYLVAIVPMGLVLKLLRKDPLRRKWDKNASTYWIAREPGPKPETMKYQF